MNIGRLAYNVYSKIFGHDQVLNTFINAYSDNYKSISRKANIDRGNEVFGNVQMDEFVKINNSGTHINGDVNIGRYTHLNGENSLVGEINIGQFNAIAKRVRMRTYNHPMRYASVHGKTYDIIGVTHEPEQKGPIEIGNDVWIGSDVKILSGVTIGDGAVIGADSVVVGDVEPYSVVAGVPAEHKYFRFSEKIRNVLLDIKWWDWPIQKMRDNSDFFEKDLTKYESRGEILQLIN
ncbi:CatB-related O-acetyltransferase [Halodesulfurarchaeum sp. HSR-GB]|uniref:CatB-related O-acetyltransferase n=1 Tax=Halodesulfurarchaeum sp. HSR-GB TaxID=3074077 RepID=UPI00285B3DF1|nr:CatB-related O-acetyltransferase [Halodesulfurarchaeum sp. HSR-GB]MDR5657388.1 CatB-related O-acetyltransferase [Halodesulfurarchaeum sp. HSR-GB]